MSNALRKQYRTLLEAPEILVMPGVFDGFSTAIVEKLGFKAGFVSGAGISESALGLADMGVMGLEDNLARARALADISSIPLQADADTGYGNAVNVYQYGARLREGWPLGRDNRGSGLAETVRTSCWKECHSVRRSGRQDQGGGGRPDR